VSCQRGPVRAIFGALGRVARRDLQSFRSLQVNNFFLFVALLMYGAFESGLAPRSAYPFLLLLGFLLLFPLSGDPLARIPRVRRESWPLSAHQRFALRLASLALSPVLWIAIAVMASASLALAALFLTLSIGTQLLLALGRRPAWTPQAKVPPIPGRLGLLVRKDARQMLTVLDTWVAILLSTGAAVWRVLDRHADPEALPILAILIALALSTYAQSLFGLDTPSGHTWYRASPLSGWKILLAKDAAFLGVLLVLLLPVSELTGLTFGLTALAVGHIPSVALRLPVERWRFTGGRVLYAFLQVIPAIMLSLAVRQIGPVFLAPALALWAVSLAVLGRRYTESRR